MELEEAILRVAALGWQEEPASNTAAALEAAEYYGRYEGLPPHIELDDDGRKARLLKDLTFWRPDGSRWHAPAGITVDGASIPKPFWTLIGGPWSGPYRNASIVHDRFCDTRETRWKETHRMFYDAMRCSEVAKLKAKVMFYAVYRFGPRWPDPGAGGLEAVAEIATARPQDDPATILADAEAIFEHDLSPDEIEALAETRQMQAPAPAALETEAPVDAALARARLIVVPGGSGTFEDCEAVAREARRLPGFVLERFERKRIRILACRGSVTDFQRSLRDKIPRGWEGTGRSWNDVPGTYLEREKRVIIATIDQDGARVVPTRATRLHGSINLTVHESLHGYDYGSGHSALGDGAFIAARNADLAALDAYQRQAGNAGIEETYAESGSRYVAEADALRAQAPHLHAYWAEQAGPLQELIGAAPALEAAEGAGPIGTARFAEDGALELDLRAEDEEVGAIGHALLTISPDDDAYERLTARLAPGGALEAAGAEILFYAEPEGDGGGDAPDR